MGFDTFNQIVLPIISVFGLLATASLITIFRRPRDIPNVPDRKYLLSLLTSCLVVLLIVFPFNITAYILATFPFGVVACKLLEFAKVLSYGVLVYTLVAISIASFLKVKAAVYQSNSNMEAQKEKHRAIAAVIAIWIIAGLCGIPALMFNVVVTGYSDPNQYCLLTEENYMNYNLPPFYTLVYYIIPVVLMFIFYGLIGAFLICHNIEDVPIEERNEVKTRLLEARRITLIGLFMFSVVLILHLPAAVYMVVLDAGIFSRLSYPLWYILYSILPLGLYIICPELRERLRYYFAHFGSKIKRSENEEAVAPTTNSFV